MSEETQDRLVTPYIPWETFLSFIAHLKATAVPSRIDKSVMPSDMAPLVRGQVQSALRFLGLTDAAGTTQPSLRELVSAYDTETWRDTVTEKLIDRYDVVVGDFDLSTATQHQLDEKFEAAGVGGQMRLKSIRFYLALVTETGSTFSPHLVSRRKPTAPRPAAARKKRTATPETKGKDLAGRVVPKPTDEEESNTPGTVSYPMFFKGKPQGKIVVPANLSKDDQKVVQLTVAVVMAYADQTDAT